MSARRSRSGQPITSKISDDQVNDLVLKLQQLLPEIHIHRSHKASASKVLQETCNYIRSLHLEVDNLNERLVELLQNTDSTQASIIKSLLSQ
ncbi:hypothetical protein E3N88_25766 [Mikania micrantha]|uniref:BHLH domain-containing protein n=1 Tax=Mikania micrantha TaxID=192012 RepID=A0A5N6N676_9ASTR|nr:hypothetical protein E3N88_25766 [Mikania micrantha]